MPTSSEHEQDSKQPTPALSEMHSAPRPVMGDFVPLELYRAVRLTALYQGLPGLDPTATAAIGRKIGGSMPVRTLNDLLVTFERLKIGSLQFSNWTGQGMHIVIQHCFCNGLPVLGKMVCDLEGFILEGALAKILHKQAGTQIRVREVLCTINGDGQCELDVEFES